MPQEYQQNKIELCFGTSGIMGAAATDKGRLSILEHAFDQGIRHFDTAPLYGLGDAENLLGKFAKKRRDDIIIATKFGLPNTIQAFYLKPIVPVARYLNRRSGVVKKIINSVRSKRVTQTSSQPTTPIIQHTVNGYDLNTLNKELDLSLAKLKTDYIDYFLFHECAKEQVSIELIEALESHVKAGKIKRYGIATNTLTSVDIIQQNPTFNGVIQCPNSFEAQDQNALGVKHERIVHSVFNSALFRRLTSLQKTNSLAFNTLIGQLDLFENSTHSPQSICLTLSAQLNPSRKLLFSSMHPKHISQSARLAENATTALPIDLKKLLNILNSIDELCE